MRALSPKAHHGLTAFWKNSHTNNLCLRLQIREQFVQVCMPALHNTSSAVHCTVMIESYQKFRVLQISPFMSSMDCHDLWYQDEAMAFASIESTWQGNDDLLDPPGPIDMGELRDFDLVEYLRVRSETHDELAAAQALLEKCLLCEGVEVFNDEASTHCEAASTQCTGSAAMAKPEQLEECAMKDKTVSRAEKDNEQLEITPLARIDALLSEITAGGLYMNYVGDAIATYAMEEFSHFSSPLVLPYSAETSLVNFSVASNGSLSSPAQASLDTCAATPFTGATSLSFVDSDGTCTAFSRHHAGTRAKMSMKRPNQVLSMPLASGEDTLNFVTAAAKASPLGIELNFGASMPVFTAGCWAREREVAAVCERAWKRCKVAC
jgi:hypothetical protein